MHEQCSGISRLRVQRLLRRRHSGATGSSPRHATSHRALEPLYLFRSLKTDASQSAAKGTNVESSRIRSSTSGSLEEAQASAV
jgi:hypothetical protein